VYDVVRGNAGTDRFRAGDTEPFVGAAVRPPGRLRIGWSVRPVTRGIRPDPVQVRAVADTARLLAGLGHDVREVDPRYPDPTAAFVPQFFAGIQAEADAVEHPERLERRTRETIRLGAWATPSVVERAITLGERLATRANRLFDEIDVLLTPTMANRPPLIGRLAAAGTVRATLRSMPAIAYTALWNVTGNPAASVPCGLAEDGLPVGVQLVGPPEGETTLVGLAAQVEAARPWPLFMDR
jgi:amidase